MLEYSINLTGNICELLITVFFFGGSHKKRVSKKTFVLLCSFFTAFLFLNTSFFLKESYLIILGSFLFVFCISLLYEMSWSKRIIFSTFMYLIQAFAELIIGMILSIALQIDILYAQSNHILFAICTLLSKFLAYFFALVLRKKNFSNGFKIIKQNFLLIFSLPIASILVMLLFLRCCYQINDDFFLIITLISSIILSVANIVVFNVMDKQNELIATKEKLNFAENLITKQTAHYKELYKHQEELGKFRHDIKNRLVALIALLKTSQTEKALQIMESNLDSLIEVSKNIVNSGNPVIDAILQSKLNLAKSHNITLQLFIRFESEIRIDEIELGIILGNALDNAVEAVNKLTSADNKYIRFKLIATDGRISVAITNPVETDIDTKHLFTTKEDKTKHGFGIKSIKSIASKYDGIVDFTCENSVFSTNINLSNLKV